MKKNKSDLKSYSLGSEEVEALLQADYGDKIRPINEAKLQKQQKQQRQQKHKAAVQDRFKAKSTETKTGTVEELENNEEP
jgi:hypothetical protein